MAFIDDCVREDLDTQAARIALSVEVERGEGAADFAFGKMPRHPHDANYMQGWIAALRDRVKYEDGKTVYPEACYRVDCTSDPNGLFSNTEVAASAQRGWFDDF